MAVPCRERRIMPRAGIHALAAPSNGSEVDRRWAPGAQANARRAGIAGGWHCRLGHAFPAAYLMHEGPSNVCLRLCNDVEAVVGVLLPALQMLAVKMLKQATRQGAASLDQVDGAADRKQGGCLAPRRCNGTSQ